MEGAKWWSSTNFLELISWFHSTAQCNPDQPSSLLPQHLNLIVSHPLTSLQTDIATPLDRSKCQSFTNHYIEPKINLVYLPS